MAEERDEEALQAQKDLAAISISARMPEFWPDHPRAWFIQIEAVLLPQRLSDLAKYNVVVAKMGKQAIQQVTDILTNPPDTLKYETLKTRLLTLYEESENRQVQKLIGEMELGGQKPTQLLRKMQALAKGKITDDTLIILWQNHLPASVRAVLAVAETKDPTTLASIADKVMESVSPIHVAEVNQQPSTSSSNAETAKIIAEIAKISVRLNNMEKERSRPRYRNYSRSVSRSQSRGRQSRSQSIRRTPESPDWLCYYHFNYGERAHKCILPCAWKKQEN